MKVTHPMLLTIERVAAMKAVDIFAETPEYILASVARIVEEVELAAGETLMREGEPGDCLFIVVEGELRVHSAGHTLTQLTPGRMVGELALLDPYPRSATVTAASNALLFRIDKDPFDEVMADRPEIARGVIRSLVRRIRQQGQTLTATAHTHHEPADV